VRGGRVRVLLPLFGHRITGASVSVAAEDPIVVAIEERQKLLDEAREQADREFLAVVREELQRPGASMIDVAKRAGMARENIYRLMRIYPEEETR
jgi:DNA-binding phage protein